jgi:hypothetical protein
MFDHEPTVSQNLKCPMINSRRRGNQFAFLLSASGPSRQAAFFCLAVANGALRTWGDHWRGPMLERLTQSWRSDDQIMEALGRIGASPPRDDRPAATTSLFHQARSDPRLAARL